MDLRFSILAFVTVAIMSLLFAPLFGNFTPQRLPVLLMVTCVIGGLWAFIAGTWLHWR